jgi:hypothetical protein
MRTEDHLILKAYKQSTTVINENLVARHALNQENKKRIREGKPPMTPAEIDRFLKSGAPAAANYDSTVPDVMGFTFSWGTKDSKTGFKTHWPDGAGFIDERINIGAFLNDNNYFLDKVEPVAKAIEETYKRVYHLPARGQVTIPHEELKVFLKPDSSDSRVANLAVARGYIILAASNPLVLDTQKIVIIMNPSGPGGISYGDLISITQEELNAF